MTRALTAAADALNYASQKQWNQHWTNQWAVNGYTCAGTVGAITITPQDYKLYYTDTSDGTTAWAYYEPQETFQLKDGRVQIPKGKALVLEFPDGSCLHLDEHGNFRVCDAEAKVTYRAIRNREFNPCVNASDLLADFVRYVGSVGVKRSEILQLPIGLFINWLVLEAAERDQEPPPPDIQPLPRDRMLVATIRPRCLLESCQRFVKRQLAARSMPFCNPAHAEEHMRRLVAA